MQTVRYEQEQMVRKIPVTTCRIVQEEVVKKVPYTVLRPVEERVEQQVPVQVCHMVAEQQVRKIPVTTCRMVYEERVVQKPVQVCKMAAMQETVRVPHVVEKRIPVTYTYNVPHVVCYREPIGPCGEPLSVTVPETGVSARPGRSRHFQPTQTDADAYAGPPKKRQCKRPSSAEKSLRNRYGAGRPEILDSRSRTLSPVPSKIFEIIFGPKSI